MAAVLGWPQKRREFSGETQYSSRSQSVTTVCIVYRGKHPKNKYKWLKWVFFPNFYDFTLIDRSKSVSLIGCPVHQALFLQNETKFFYQEEHLFLRDSRIVITWKAPIWYYMNFKLRILARQISRTTAIYFIHQMHPKPNQNLVLKSISRSFV